jgi:glycosyltransferase involved in cell wall biosynthesis
MSSWYPTAGNPVAGTFVREHVKAASLHDDVAVLHLAKAETEQTALWRLERDEREDLTGGLPTCRIWLRRVRFAPLRAAVRLYAAAKAFRHIAAHEFRPQIIHAHIQSAGFYAALLGRLFRTPVVVTEQSSMFPRKLLRRRDVWTARFAFGRAAAVLPVSSSLRQAIESYGIRANFTVVPNTVDTTLFRPDGATQAGHVGRILLVCLLDDADNKGVADLLRALQQVGDRRDDWRLDIVGDGPARARHERLAAQLGIADKVAFHGLKPKSDVAECMRRADFLVVASHAETFCAAAAEALSTGTPVLATRCGGPEDFVTDEVGMLVPAADVDALARGIDQMLDHAPDLSRERIAGYARQRLGAATVGRTLHGIYRRCIDAQGS